MTSAPETPTYNPFAELAAAVAKTPERERAAVFAEGVAIALYHAEEAARGLRNEGVANRIGAAARSVEFAASWERKQLADMDELKAKIEQYREQAGPGASAGSEAIDAMIDFFATKAYAVHRRAKAAGEAKIAKRANDLWYELEGEAIDRDEARA